MSTCRGDEKEEEKEKQQEEEGLRETEKVEDMGNRKTKTTSDGGYEGEDMMLYWVNGSPACFRVMFALEEKRLSRYKEKHLNFADNEHKTDDVLRFNPRGQVGRHPPLV